MGVKIMMKMIKNNNGDGGGERCYYYYYFMLHVCLIIIQKTQTELFSIDFLLDSAVVKLSVLFYNKNQTRRKNFDIKIFLFIQF